jgi:hypothetical protein
VGGGVVPGLRITGSAVVPLARYERAQPLYLSLPVGDIDQFSIGCFNWMYGWLKPFGCVGQVANLPHTARTLKEKKIARHLLTVVGTTALPARCNPTKVVVS